LVLVQAKSKNIIGLGKQATKIEKDYLKFLLKKKGVKFAANCWTNLIWGDELIKDLPHKNSKI
jgi:hypothetical protein